MGMALWLGCAVLVFFAARRVPFARPRGWIVELLEAILSAMLLGALATALDFAGWKEPDWRAGLFVFFGSATVVGRLRFLRMLRSPTPHSPLPTPSKKP